MKRTILCWALVCVLPSLVFSASWTLTEGVNLDGPGKKVDVKLDGKLIARVVYGEGQIKPYLHVYGEDGELLTNGGLNGDGKPIGRYPHHRGIFIGWNRITSDLGGPFDLWHFNNGGKMELVKWETLDGTQAAATLIAQIDWRGGRKDTQGSDLLLTETRRLVISRPAGKQTQVDAHFVLKAARDLTLGGDLQHAGIHFRAADEANTRRTETSYLWEPDLPGPGGKVASQEMKWCRLLFPIGEHWYNAVELNAPSNPVDELSWRDYGRFGFFFKKSLKAGETLALDYRFLIQPAAAPVQKPKESSDQLTQSRAECQAQYQAFARAVK
jgi:hypothetical protein